MIPTALIVAISCVITLYLLAFPFVAAWWTHKLTNGALVEKSVNQTIDTAKMTAATTADTAKVLARMLEASEQRAMATQQLTSQLEYSRLQFSSSPSTHGNNGGAVPPRPAPPSALVDEEDVDPEAARFEPLGRG